MSKTTPCKVAGTRWQLRKADWPKAQSAAATLKTKMADYAVANPLYGLPPARLRTRVLDPVAQQHRTAFQGMAALQHHRRDGRALVGFGFRGIEDARRPLCTVHD